MAKKQSRNKQKIVITINFVWSGRKYQTLLSLPSVTQKYLKLNKLIKIDWNELDNVRYIL